MTVQNDSAQALRLLQSGQHKAAYKAARAGMQKHPKQPLFPNIAGVALCATGKPRDGLALFARALKLDPGFAEAHKNMAQTHIVLGQPARALGHLDLLDRQGKTDAETAYLHAQALWQTGQTVAALAAATRAIDLAPRHRRGYALRALLREQTEGPAAAIEDYDAMLRLDPLDAEAMLRKSLPLARIGRHAEALALVERARELRPGHPETLIRLATMLNETGQADAARAALRAVLEGDAGNAGALGRLAFLQDKAANAALGPRLKAALEKAAKGSEDRATLAFALAHLARQAGDVPDEARWLTLANRTQAALVPYDPQSDARLHADIASRFAEPVAATPRDTEAAVPVFVLGLPRSGTSLTEAMLSGHPEIAATGELAAAGLLVQEILNNGAPFDPAAFAAAYRAALPDLPEGTRAFVDKMPENYRIVGFLHAALPKARIIHLRRDPRDIALSMWRTQFAGPALAYTYDLQHIAHRANLYAGLMTHWHRVCPGAILDIDYADLVRDPEAATRRMAEFIGVDWHPAMIRPEDNTAPVQTASVNQVREPVHARALGGWQDRTELLAPFLAALDPALWPGVR